MTTLTVDELAGKDLTILDVANGDAARLGIEVAGPAQVTVVVSDPARAVGRIVIHAFGRDGFVFLDNARGMAVDGTLRILGDDGMVLVNETACGFVGLRMALLRSRRQTLFWGRHATAVDISIEIEGDGQSVVIGDDALIAGDVWIRNHDMHAINDLATGHLVSRAPVTTILERHVWLGHGALLLNCERIGRGAVVGARSLVKGCVPECVIVAGMPARVLRRGVSWGRDCSGMTAAERVSAGQPK